MTRSIVSLAASLALVVAMPARAAAPEPCINPAEMHGLIAYFLPEVIGEVTRNCSAQVPPGSYLRSGLPRIGAELKSRNEEFWPTARSAFFKMSKARDAKAMAALSDEALKPMVDAMMAEKIKIPVRPADCADVNDITESLAPLSADQTVHLLATIFGAVARRDSTMRSCPREAQ